MTRKRTQSSVPTSADSLHYTRSTLINQQSLNGRTEYYMNQLRSFAITDSPERFQKGTNTLVNAMEWAKEQRGQLVKYAN
jgi:hypothetical protein